MPFNDTGGVVGVPRESAMWTTFLVTSLQYPAEAWRSG